MWQSLPRKRAFPSRFPSPHLKIFQRQYYNGLFFVFSFLVLWKCVGGLRLNVVQFDVASDAFHPLLDADRAATLSDRLEKGIQEDFVYRTQKVGHALHFDRVRAFHWRVYPHVGAGDKREYYAPEGSQWTSTKQRQELVSRIFGKHVDFMAQVPNTFSRVIAFGFGDNFFELNSDFVVEFLGVSVFLRFEVLDALLEPGGRRHSRSRFRTLVPARCRVTLLVTKQWFTLLVLKTFLFDSPRRWAFSRQM